MKKEHHNTSLTCEALNSAESVPQSTRIRLMVEFAPSVSLERQPLVIREGDTAIFRSGFTNCIYHYLVKRYEYFALFLKFCFHLL